MTPYYADATTTVYAGDCLDVLATLPDASVDAVCTDPPYGLEFMGKAWDSFGRDTGNGYQETPRWGGERERTDIADDPRGRTKAPNFYTAGAPFQRWCELWTAECLRVLKPGGHLLAFGGTRTWHRLACAVEDAGFEVRDSIAWLYGSGFPKSLDVSKAIDKAAGAEREVVGPNKFAALNGQANLTCYGTASRPDETAPATDAAREWQGWGTALKPAHEPVVVARKPLTEQGILATIGSHLDALETTWQAPEADPTTRTGAAESLPVQTATLPSESETTTSSSIVTSWRRCWVELCELTSTSTIATTSETTTALRTLSSSLSRLTDESTAASATSRRGSTPLASAVDNLFASVVCGLRATHALSVDAPATSSTHTSPQDAAAPGSPRYEPIVVARKPLVGTVAANVLAHGTGALNVDGCRVGEWSDFDRRNMAVSSSGQGGQGHVGYMAMPGSDAPLVPNPAGRWPANVVLDESQAEALDEQSGESSSGKASGIYGTHADTGRNETYGAGLSSATPNQPPKGDTGGASRFFYTAKADASERVRVDGIAHPTVKPLALMRWLVRLVTPPGGVVLEPFAGSGTTVEACILEGFRCIAIEREADYLPLIVQRINRRRDPVQAVKGAGGDGGLFDLLGEVSA